MDKLVALVFFAGLALHGAWYGVPLFAQAITQPWPTELTCAQLADGAEGDWVRVWNCEASIDDTTLSVDYRGEYVHSLSIGLVPRGRGGESVVSVQTSAWTRAFSRRPGDRDLSLDASLEQLSGEPHLDDAGVQRLNELADAQSAAWAEIEEAAAMGFEGRLEPFGDRWILRHGASPSGWAPLPYLLELAFALAGLWSVMLGRSLRLRVPMPRAFASS